MSSEVKKKERQNLLVQVEDFLHKQQFNGQIFQKKNEIEEEVDVFLNLLGNINPSETPQNKAQLSTIISQGSYDSTLPSFRETKLKYVDQFVQQMLKFLRDIKKEIQGNESIIQQLIDQIYQFYLNQMNDIDKLIQYTYDVGNRKPNFVQFKDELEQKELKPTILEQELESSLVQAHQLNDQLNNLLKQKSSENYYKDKQCKQALQSIAMLESQLNQFKGQFQKFNQMVKVINGQLSDCVNGPSLDNNKTKIGSNNKTAYKTINSYRTHFTNTTPNKKGKLEENYRSISQNSYRSRREEVDKVYKQLLKNYL
ncbi:unnamed protein product [Paramecium primaurelia]|uniref:Uncharacterized protein n=1 Tax=Paramecium primaurelia TaxID=5886 RepID=A0A8S1QDU8_PARPR|nr:unnamed protein product [Paramecium primaurelia]